LANIESKVSRTSTTNVETAPDSSVPQPTETNAMSARKSRAVGIFDKHRTGIDETIRRNWQSTHHIESSREGDNRHINKPQDNRTKGAGPPATSALPTLSSTPSLTAEIPKRIVAPGYILCEPCQMEVRETDWERHQNGTAHLMSKDSPIQPLDRLKLGHVRLFIPLLLSVWWIFTNNGYLYETEVAHICSLTVDFFWWYNSIRKTKASGC